MWAWGYNGYGQIGDGTTNDVSSPTQAGTENNWVSVAAGKYHTVALKSDGTLWTWGYNFYGQLGDGTTNDIYSPTKLGLDNDWVFIAAGDHHTMALKSDGTLWAWGYNGYGQIGDGTTNNALSPVQAGTDNNWTSVAAGKYHTVALKSDGTLWTWGYNFYGQLGDGTTNDISSPAQAGLDDDWVFIAAGTYHTMALKSDGTIWAWGYNGYGQLGDGTTNDSYVPAQTGLDNNWVYILAGDFHTIALKSDGTRWTWGLNDDGQLGDGTTVDKHVPAQAGIDNQWTSSGTGGAGYTLLHKSDGTLWAWGYNGYGQLGDGTTNDTSTPTQIWFDNNWSYVAVGTFHTAFLKLDGTLWASGRNDEGALGYSTTEICNSKPCATVPGQVGGDNDWVSIKEGGGGHHTVALKTDGSLWSWGMNDYVQLGYTPTDTCNGKPCATSPGQIGTDTDWVYIAAGSHQTIALKSDGSLWGWGENYYGQLGDGTWNKKYTPYRTNTDNDWIAITMGHDHSVAIKSNGTLWAWGHNGFGELGYSTTYTCNGNPCSLSPGQVGTDNDWVAVAAGYRHTVALKSDGTLWAWGANFLGQIGDGTEIHRDSPVQVGTDNDWSSIAAGGGSHTIALKSDGTLWSWGYNGLGQLGRTSSDSCTPGSNTYACAKNPGQAGTDNDWSYIASGGHSTYAFKSDGTLWAWGDNEYGQLGDGTTLARASPVIITHRPMAEPNGPYADIEGQIIILDGAGSTDLDGEIVLYEWDIDDNGTYDYSSSSPTQSHIYVQQGTYDIRLRVTDDLGATDEGITVAYITDSSPTADFTGTPTSGPVNLLVNFTDNSSGYDQPLSYEWDFDNDDIVDSTIQNPSYTYSSPGTYTVKLTVTDSDGSTSTLTRTNYITVTPPYHLLTLIVSGSGSGMVTSSPSGINCYSAGGDCAETYEEGTLVILTAEPADGSSTFTGWSGGSCSGTGSCTVTMNAAEIVTATFDVCPNGPIRNSNTSVEYSSLQDAYDNADDGDTLQAQTLIITEDVDINIDKTVTMQGGSNCDYTNNIGATTLNGIISINDGTLITEHFIIQ